MITETVTHYTAYKPRPFSKGERETVTLLYGSLNWKYERLLQGAFHNLNYKAQPLPNVTRADLDAGKELIDVGACSPTTFITGNLVNFLKSEAEKRGKEDVVDKYVYLTAGACGACRFGQYQQSYAMALDTLGLKDFRILLMDQDDLDQGSATEEGWRSICPLRQGSYGPFSAAMS